MSNNEYLQYSRTEKNDEFYTFARDVKKELDNYKEHFEGKIIYCNFDNPEKSEFWKYFVQNFTELKLKKVICTYLTTDQYAYKTVYEKGVTKKYPLKENGDFRSDECIDIMQEADIIITNPAWSLFREFIELLMKYEKKFLVIGNKNALSYKEIFNYFSENKLWLGYYGPNMYLTPEGKTAKVAGLSKWFTNLDIDKRHKSLKLEKKYYLEDGTINSEYKKLVNYDAINIDKVKEIPCDYEGEMAVPISYLDKHNPDDYEIIGTSYTLYDDINKYIDENTKFVIGGPAFYIKEREDAVKRLYYRVVIKKKNKGE